MATTEEDDYLPLRALNDLLYCPRRCALHRVEEVWIDNRFTTQGTVVHARAHGDPSEMEQAGSMRLVRGMWLRSDALRMVGRADIVEFHPDGPFPVEYKHGRRRRWDNDDVQICAQAICLEEMLGVCVPAGAIYHAGSRRRRQVIFTPTIRSLTIAAARSLHELVSSGTTPPPVVKPQCNGCSVRPICMPELLSDPGRVDEYLATLYLPTDPSSSD